MVTVYLVESISSKKNVLNIIGSAISGNETSLPSENVSSSIDLNSISSDFKNNINIVEYLKGFETSSCFSVVNVMISFKHMWFS